MRPVRQTRFNRGDGNCFNACIATLLDLPIEAVDVVWNEDNWLKQLDEILHPLGYCFIEWNWDKDSQPWHWVGPCYMIATGDGPRGCKHSVVVHHYIDSDDGKHCVVNHWDPHPDEKFLKTIDYVGVLFPHWEDMPNPTGLRCAGLGAHKQDPIVGISENQKGE
jgi:hypothetical protein